MEAGKGCAGLQSLRSLSLWAALSHNDCRQGKQLPFKMWPAPSSSFILSTKLEQLVYPSPASGGIFLKASVRVSLPC